MLTTSDVFLDTEIFVNKNFNYGHNDFVALLEHVADGTITLYLTEVHHREIKKKIEDLVSDAKRALQRCV